MYDFQNDVLICLVKLPIFQDKEIPDKLSIESVVFLWMVLHYKMFCVGINVQELLYTGAIRDLIIRKYNQTSERELGTN